LDENGAEQQSYDISNGYGKEKNRELNSLHDDESGHSFDDRNSTSEKAKEWGQDRRFRESSEEPKKRRTEEQRKDHDDLE